MGIISRFTDIMSANINAIISKAESDNADKLLTKYIQDAKENLGQIKAETAAVIAEEMALARKLTETEDLIKKYEGYAIQAVKQQNDGDARKFLARNADLEIQKQDLTKQYEIAKQNSEKMRQMTTKTISDIETASAKLDELKRKLNIAKQQEKISQIKTPEFDNLFEVVQKRIDKAEAMVQLQEDQDELADLEEKYSQTSDDTKATSIEEQLAKIKANL